jgi:hypothetical protein
MEREQCFDISKSSFIICRLVRLGVRHPPGTRDQFFPFSLWLFFWHFRVCWCGAPSLTRSRVCTFQFLPGIASAGFLRSESHGTHENSLLSLFLRLPQPGGCIYFLQEQGFDITLLCVCIRMPLIAARQRLGNHVTAATNTHKTMEELLNPSFSVWSLPQENCYFRKFSMMPEEEEEEGALRRLYF